MANPNWVKGVSGNPAGKKPGTLNKSGQSARSLAAVHGPRAIERLAEIAESNDLPAAAMACRTLIERWAGKPPQSIRKTVEHIRRNPRELSLEQLERRLEEMSATPTGAH